MKMLKVLPIFLMMMFVVASCGGGDTESKCDGVTCKADEACLPSTGKCAPKGSGDECVPACTDGKVCNNGSCEAGATGDIKTISAARLKVKTFCTDDQIKNGGFCNVREGDAEVIASVEGIVVEVNNKKGFTINEATNVDFGGISVYLKKPMTLTATVKVGDKVKVVGALAEAYGTTQFAFETGDEDKVTVLASDVTPPAALSLAVTDLKEKDESKMVELTGGPFTVKTAASADNHFLTTLEDANGNSFGMNGIKEETYYNPEVGVVITAMKGILSVNREGLAVILARKSNLTIQ